VLAGQAALVLGRLELVAERERQTRMLDTVLSHSPVGVVLEDAAGNVLYANPEVERIYGASPADLTGRAAQALLDREAAVMDADQRHTLVAEAYEQSERLLSLVENQLLIAKLEAGRFEPNRAPVPLLRTLEQVLADMRNRYGERVAIVVRRFSPNLPSAYCE